ncbi:MAG: Universal stress protein uspA [Geminicoccaceae bacterium]|nr:Universal stress protein uspA [Geminicoccaceae bacterium]
MRVEKVVVGIDFSRPGIDAARWVMRHFAPDAEMIFAHVIDIPRTPTFAPDSRTPRTEVDSSVRGEVESRLRETAKLLGAEDVRTVIRTGSPHTELAKFAAETGADVVAVGPHGDRPRPWKMLGTTAERLVRSAAPAALVVANPGDTPRRILVAVDDAPISLTVLSWVKGLADTLGADVTALHVLEHRATSFAPSVMEAGSGPDGPAPTGPDLRREASRWLDALADRSLGRGRTETIVSTGNAGDSILETAGNVDAHLIVIGRRGSGTRIPAVTGSTVSTVLHGAPCPVLVITEEPDFGTDSSVEA